MFGLGIWEFVIVVVIGLIVLGPKKLPGVARQLGRMMREFRRASNELRYGLDDAVRMDESGDKPDPYANPAPKLTQLPVGESDTDTGGEASKAATESDDANIETSADTKNEPEGTDG